MTEPRMILRGAGNPQEVQGEIELSAEEQASLTESLKGAQAGLRRARMELMREAQKGTE